jgi:peptide/nickel transport system permease protein
LVDILLSMPGLVLALALAAAFGPSVQNVTIAVGIVVAPSFVRVLRSATLVVAQQEFVAAARSMGASDGRILFRHVLPSTVAPAIVLATVTFANAVIVEASLSFLGMGPPPPDATWGSMLSEGRQFLRGSPWMSTFAGLAIMVTVLALNLAGDGLRDVLDPRLRGSRRGVTQAQGEKHGTT